LRTFFHYFIRLALAIAFIIGVFKIYKYRDTVTIDATDFSMDPLACPQGTHRVDSYLTDPKKFATGDLIAFYLPGQHQEIRVAKVAAVEGQHIEFTADQVLIDGKQSKFPTGNAKFPEIIVPKGTVYVICDQPQNGSDSIKMGPLPAFMIYGKLK
jgi:signal peptidase I